MSESFQQRSAFETWPIAKPSLRILAFLIDFICCSLLVVLALKVFHYPILLKNIFYFIFIAMWFWEIFFVIFWGASPGKKILGLELYAPKYDGLPSPVQISLRTIMFWLSFALLFVGILPILYRRDHRGWHDQIGEVLVVGKSRSYPHPFFVKTIPSLLLILSLILFSGIGAKVFKHGMDLTYQASTKNNCGDPAVLVNQTASTLSHIVISPVWRACWVSLNNVFRNFEDSNIYQLLQISYAYHDLFFIPQENRIHFYKNNIKPLEDKICKTTSKECNSALYLSSMVLNNDISFNEQWFQDLEGKLSFTKEPLSNYVEQIRDSKLAKQDKDAAIMALKPKMVLNRSFDSGNSKWQEGLICLEQIRAGKKPNACERWYEIHSLVLNARNDEGMELDTYLSRQPRDFVFFELSEIRDVVIEPSQSKKQEFLSTYPRTRLFYPLVSSL